MITDGYKGHYNEHALIRNMMDVRVYIPERNIIMEEHFCYWYFARSRDSPHSLLYNLLKKPWDSCTIHTMLTVTTKY